MSIIKAEDVSFKYGENEVLHGVNFNIDNCKMIGIIGPNGCGKTTLLKNISGYFKPYKGNIYISGKDINKMTAKERARYIGYVPQELSYDFDFSCKDIVMMGRMPYLRRFQKEGRNDFRIVRECMEMTDTWGFRDKSINELSGGQRQRVYIARALAQKPRILLLDEPVSHLDIKYQVDILSLLKDLSYQGILILTILHDINLASQFCDEILMMSNGDIVSEGAPNKVLTVENIEKTFSVNVEIMENPITTTPYIIPTKKREENLKVV